MSNNPILKSPKSILLYLIFVAVIAILYLNLVTFEIKTSLSISVTDSLVFNLLLAALGLSFWYSSIYLSIEHNKISKVILTHFGGGIIISIVWLALGYFVVISIVNDTEMFGDFFVKTIKSRFIIGILYYFLLTAFYYVVIYYSGFQERTLKETELKKSCYRSRVKVAKIPNQSAFYI